MKKSMAILAAVLLIAAIARTAQMLYHKYAKK